jgi:hypothetical protein
VTRIPDALSEAFRVLRPGGRLMVLEFSQLPNPAMQWAYDRYSFNVIPVMGQIVANDRDSYQYLVESIRKFPDQDRFAAMIRDAGFRAGAIPQPVYGHRRAAFGLEDLNMRGPHNIWRLIRTGATFERTGAMKRRTRCDGGPAAPARCRTRAGLALPLAGLSRAILPAAGHARDHSAGARLHQVRSGAVDPSRRGGVELADQLRYLQDKLPPFPTSTAPGDGSADLGRPVDQVFCRIFRARSGRFHRAGAPRAPRRYRQEVAVKVLRPGIERAFRRDIDAFHFGASMIERAVARHPPPATQPM